MSREQIPQSYYEIIEACAGPGCPFCRLVEQIGDRFLDACLHGTVTDPDIRFKYRESIGFCNRHAWRLPGSGGGRRLGIAIIYQDFIKQVTRKLEKARYNASGGASLGRLQESLNRKKPTGATQSLVRSLEPQKPCPACVQEKELETLAMTTLVDFLPNDERLREAFQASDGLCLPHLRRALELVRNETAFEILIEDARQKMGKLIEELDEFIRKHDHRFQDESFAAEGDSWQRALARIAGMPAPLPGKSRQKKQL
ncbi:MAG: hypothetical protein JXM69_08940 [Anaerolineae bacterium]|nr:hypothetical protein [Anaerolineae bacterium]